MEMETMTFKVQTEYPIALNSMDHTVKIFENGEWVQEGGTRLDCSTNSAFNNKLYELLPNHPLFITDWGCAGGCFIEQCVNDGHKAVGLEGSDYSFLRKRESWGRIPNNLFTCDISNPFQITYEDKPCLFDVITSWEVLEHLNEVEIVQLWKNIVNHLKDDGYFIGSISNSKENNHLIQKPVEWWRDSWEREGLTENGLVNLFNNEFIRGPNQRAPASFVVSLRKKQ